MKPGFALTLAHDGVTLLQRSPRGWLIVGEVALDDPAFDSAVAGLRTTALSLAPDTPLATKLVIPGSEMLYTVIEVPGPDPEARRKAVRAALEGMTPYNVDELAFDWSGSGQALNVAVVARETLAEAEAFASRHGFNPVGFVAQPEAGQFIGEPFFGETSCAAEVIGKGDKLERDLIPVQVVGRAERPTGQARAIFGAKLPFGGREGSARVSDAPQDAPTEAEPPAVAQPPVETVPTAQRAQPQPGAPPETDPEPAAPGSEDNSTETRSETLSGPEAAPDQDTPPPASAKGDAPAASGTEQTGDAPDAQSALFVSRRQPAGEKSPDKPEPSEHPEQTPSSVVTGPKTDVGSAPAKVTQAAESQGKSDPETQAPGGDSPAPLTAKAWPRPGPEAQAPQKGSGLMSGLSALATRARSAVSGAKPQAGRSMPGNGAAPSKGNARAAGPQPAPAIPGKSAAEPTEHGPAPKPAGPAQRLGVGDAKDKAGKKKTTKQGRRDGGASGKRKSDAPELITPPKPSPPLSAAAARNEAEAMTIFGARRHEQPGGGRTRLALVIAAVLALAVGGAAVWAGYFLLTSGTDDTADIVAAVEPEAESPGEPAPGAEDGASAPAAGDDATAAEAPDASPPADEAADEAPAATDDAAAEAPDARDEPETPAQTDPLDEAPFNVDQAIAEALDDVATAETPAPQGSPAPDSPVGGAEGPASPGIGTPPDDLASGIDSTPPVPGSAPDEAPEIGGEQIAAVTPEVAAPEAAPDAVEDSAGEELGQTPREMTRAEYEAAYEETGIWPFAPEVATLPRPGSLGDLRDPLADATPPSQPPGSPDQDALRADTVPASPAPPAPFEQAAPAASADTPEATPAEAQPEVTVTVGVPPVSPPLRRDVFPRLLLHEGATPVPEGASPAPRPAGVSPAGASPDAGAEQGALEPESTADEGVAIQRAAAEALRPTARPAGVSPDTGAEQGAPEPESTADEGVAIQRAAAEALRPAARPAGVSPDTGAEQGAPEPDNAADEGLAIQRAAAEALRPAARPPQAASQLATAAPSAEADMQDAAAPPEEEPTPAAAVEVRQASLAADALRPAPRPSAQRGAPGTLAMQEPAPGSDGEAMQVALATPEAQTPRPRTRLELEGAEADEPAADAPEEPASELVVARSPQPGLRPSGFAERTARLQEQSAPAAPTSQQEQSPTPARSAAAATPSIPTTASVAQQATLEGAINLRRMNLIGVFGTESDRRALVRMSNGQVVSVRVGDRLDGGQVAAIGESELRYVKNGRNNVLRIGES